MNKKYITCFALTGLLVATGLTSAVAGENKDEQAKLEAQAKVTKADAEKTALAKVPGGKIKEGGIEEENGKLIWSFDIATEGSKDITEVAVDAKTGAVVDVATETPADQAKEKEADAKETKAKGKKEKGEDKD